MQENELTDKEQKKINSILSRVAKISKEIDELGYTVYITDRFNLMSNNSHGFTEKDVVVSVSVSGWSGGDW